MRVAPGINYIPLLCSFMHWMREQSNPFFFFALRISLKKSEKRIKQCDILILPIARQKRLIFSVYGQNDMKFREFE